MVAACFRFIGGSFDSGDGRRQLQRDARGGVSIGVVVHDARERADGDVELGGEACERYAREVSSADLVSLCPTQLGGEGATAAPRVGGHFLHARPLP